MGKKGSALTSKPRWRLRGAKYASADGLDGSPISTTLVEVKLSGVGGVGGRGDRTLTIFFALRLAWRKLRKFMLLAPTWRGCERGRETSYQTECNKRYKVGPTSGTWENDMR